jgi:PAS domain S-box-containing protein
MASILGFSSPEELIRECTDIARQSYVHPEQREEFKRLMEQQNKLFGFEYEVSRKDGSVAWVSETAQAFRDATGRIVRYDGILINITERKRMEDALRQSEEKYRGIFENVQDVYYEATVEGTILEVSPSIEVMSKGQYRRDDLIGKSIWDFYADIGERQALLDVLRERGRVTDFEITLKNRDGSLIPCSISSKIQFNDQGRPEKIIGSMRDVTERKQAEEELRENEAFLSTLMETASSAIFIYQDERFTFINRASEILTGYSRNELIGMRFLEIVHPDHREMIVQRGLARQRGDKLPERYEFRIVQKDGSVCWVDFTGGRIEWHGRPAAIGTAFDITESKCMQDQIRKDLIVKEVMLKEIHHRVRNNLNVIVSLLNLQSDLITTKRQALKAFEETKNRIYAMALVHSNLYKEEDFSRVDLLSFIQNLTQNLMQVYNTDVKIDVHIEDLSLDLNNAVPCGLILNELVTNALKYAFKDKHKGLITIEFRMQKDNTCELTVQDNGAGLPEDLDIPKTKSLGLLIVNQLVDQIDGVLKITRGKGAKFQITFPVSAT